jgi:hypothetical protein
MGRKVEGITLDLTRISETDAFVLEDIIVKAPVPAPRAPRIPFPDWLVELYKDPCTFCGTKEKSMHFDHINMFDKRDSVCSMANRGCSKEEVMTEINKCQLLCIPCHTKVTRIERKLGFTKNKCKFNKILRKGVDVEQLRSELKAAYSEKMEKIYAGMRGDFRLRAIPPIMIAIIIWGIYIYL